MIETIFVLAILILLLLFLVRPGKLSPEQEAPFRGRCYAHRGLYDPKGPVPENSLAAFQAAAEAGYGIELDVQLSKDGEVVVFHDDTVDRVTGCSGRVDSFTLQELQKMSLNGTDQTIPLFCDVLREVGGRVPLIVELKTGPNNRELCEKTWALLREYEGLYCVESFDPRLMQWFKKNVPGVLRGQLACSCEDFKHIRLSFAASRLLGNCLSRPQFIAWGSEKKNLMVKLCESFGPMTIRWNNRDAEELRQLQEEYDGVIFEFYHPAPRY